jgi:hypothetical protein
MNWKRNLDIIFVLVTADMLINLNWEWATVKSFLVGGVIGTWAMIKYFTHSTR